MAQEKKGKDVITEKDIEEALEQLRIGGYTQITFEEYKEGLTENIIFTLPVSPEETEKVKEIIKAIRENELDVSDSLFSIFTEEAHKMFCEKFGGIREDREKFIEMQEKKCRGEKIRFFRKKAEDENTVYRFYAAITEENFRKVILQHKEWAAFHPQGPKAEEMSYIR